MDIYYIPWQTKTFEIAAIQNAVQAGISVACPYCEEETNRPQCRYAPEASYISVFLILLEFCPKIECLKSDAGYLLLARARSLQTDPHTLWKALLQSSTYL